MLTISSGHSADYLTGAVATGRENYYTGAVAAGEPPGRWYGRGAAALGLAGEVDAQDMTALYEHFIDPRDEAFRDPSRWGEEEIARLGHTGRRYQTEEDIYAASLKKEPDADAERRAQLQVEAGKKARKNVAFMDATFSVQKSITVLHTSFEAQEVKARGAAERAHAALARLENGRGADAAASGASASGAPDADAARRLAAELTAAEAEATAWGEFRRAVEDAIWAGNQAALEYLADKAGVSRVGHHGGAAGRWVDAHDWTVASFFQHDSRNHDPQLHIHNAILNRVHCADGTWRTLDGKSVYRYRGAAAAVGERVMEHHLTRSLNVEFATRPDGKSREIVGIGQAVLDMVSTRRAAITARTRARVREFEAQFGREPNALELDRLQRTATFASRRAKSHDGETVAERLERVDTQLRAEVAGGLAEVAEYVLDRAAAAGSREPTRWSQREVIETATADVQGTKAGWTSPDLTRAISNALPDYLGDLDAEQIPRLLDGLTAEAIEVGADRLNTDRPGDAAVPDDLRRADGTSAYQAPGAQLYATPEHVRAERLLASVSTDRDAAALPPAAVDAFLTELSESGHDLGADQVAAIRGVLSSGSRVETLVGPAGTGKSFVVGTLAKAWQDEALWRDHQPRRVVGLASSQIAAGVLADEGLDTHNIARWLNAQDRLASGSQRPSDQASAVGAGDLVVVDESAMADTADLARIHAVCQGAGAKLLLCGDHRQLTAVGAAGGMELAAKAGVRHELSETRRFDQDWEGPASLRLRERDQTVLDEYHKHGRLVDGGAAEQTQAAAREAWLADTLSGRRSLLIVGTNEQAATVSAELRAKLIDLGRVDEDGAVPLGLQGTYASRGDLIQTRRNAWDLAGYQANRRGPINRETFRVVDTHDDGSLAVAPIVGRAAAGEQLGDPISLPASYVAKHVALGYASTVHAAQGLTVDTSHMVVSGRTGADALYVGLSRGRETNTAYVVTRPVGADAPTGEVNQTVHRSARATLAGLFDSEDPQLSALAAAAESAAEAESVRTPAELFRDAVERATANRTTHWLDELVADGSLSEQQRDQIAVENGATTLNALLRRVELGGADPKQRLVDAVRSRDLDNAKQISNVLHSRITAGSALDPAGDTYTGRIPHVDDPQYRTYLSTLAAAADQRQAELGAAAASETPPWAVEALGPVPADETAREEWQKKAGAVAAHRELMGHTDPDDALGSAPKAGQVEEYASWRTAWRALGRPEADRAEAEMSTGQLRVRVRAYQREKTWAPAYVANELAGTRQAADKHRHAAQVRRAEAIQGDDPDQRADLLQRADEADALAATLDEQAAALDEADLVRGEWYAHTAETRAAADRAQAELSARELDSATVDDRATAAEWIAAHEAAAIDEDPHRQIHDEHELADTHDQRARDLAAVGLTPPDDERAEDAPDDIRIQTADRVPDDDQRDTVRVPTADETADAVGRARRALGELRHRTAAEDQRAADEARDAELAAWHDDQPAREPDRVEQTTAAADEAGPVLEPAVPLDD